MIRRVVPARSPSLASAVGRAGLAIASPFHSSTQASTPASASLRAGRPGRPDPADRNEPPDPLPRPPSGASSWSLDEAYAWCERIVLLHDENFPVASRFVPALLRRHVWAVYAFARTADDFADEPRYATRRAAALDHWEEQLEGAFHGHAEHPIFVALRHTVEHCDIPISPLRDLLTSFRMDLTGGRYSTFEALLGYARYSAMPVGQLLLYIFGYRDLSMHRYSDDIATALELTHFLQDLPSDLAIRDRLYVPEEDLVHFGVTEKELRAGRISDGIRELMRFEVARARSLFERGRPLTARVGRNLSFELSLIWQGGMRILDQIDAQRGDVFSRRPHLGLTDKAAMAIKAAGQRFPIPLRRLLRQPR